MARRATAIKQERAANKGILLLLDAGSSLMGHWVSMKSDGRVTVESMNALGYDALTVGQKELYRGVEVLQARRQEAHFPFLSANLISVDKKEPVFEPYVILERGGRRIGILGLSEINANQMPIVKDSLVVLDPVETAQEYVRELRGNVDLVIVLSHLGLDPDKALAEQVPGIDIIVGGSSSKLMSEPERVGQTLIVQQGYRGEWMGRLRATYDEKGNPSDYGAETITLGPSFGEDKEMADLLADYRLRYPTPTPRPRPTLDPRTHTVDRNAINAVRTTSVAATQTASAK